MNTECILMMAASYKGNLGFGIPRTLCTLSLRNACACVCECHAKQQ